MRVGRRKRPMPHSFPKARRPQMPGCGTLRAPPSQPSSHALYQGMALAVPQRDEKERALAPANERASPPERGLKPHDFRPLSARLKPCPDTKLAGSRGGTPHSPKASALTERNTRLTRPCAPAFAAFPVLGKLCGIGRTRLSPIERQRVFEGDPVRERFRIAPGN
jgi:hypothetical protein